MQVRNRYLVFAQLSVVPHVCITHFSLLHVFAQLSCICFWMAYNQSCTFNIVQIRDSTPFVSWKVLCLSCISSISWQSCSHWLKMKFRNFHFFMNWMWNYVTMHHVNRHVSHVTSQVHTVPHKNNNAMKHLF